MKTLRIYLLLVLAIILAVPAGAQKFPRPIGAVNDFAGVLSPDTKVRLEGLAREVWNKTGTALVVVIMPTIGEHEINDYVNRLYSAWGIGKKGEDKGVLIFVTVKERKMRIETGYGVEGILPDGRVGEIRDRYVIPHLRENNYDAGITQGMEAIAAIVAKEAGVSLSGRIKEHPRVGKNKEGEGFNLVGLLFIMLMFIFFLGTRTGRRLLPWLLLFTLTNGRRGGGYSGGFGGFSGGFGGFGGGMSGGGGAGGSF
ncbi:MAG: TPM domain-containing protein [Syntrophales bacterium]|nr:TPM domain-containing protein [Syntrophales bacterium]